MALGMLAAALLLGLADFGISRKYLPEITVSHRYFSFGAVKQLVLNGFWASFNMVGDILNSGLDLLVCNQMLTNLEMGQLAIAKTMQTILQGVYYIVNQTFIPRFLKSYATDAPGKVIWELKLAMKISGMLANVIFAGFAAFGLAFYRLWIPEQDIRVIYELTIITILTCIPSGPMQPLYYIYTLTLKQKLPCIITVIGGLINVASMYLLIRCAGMGVYAVAWTTVAVMCVINFVTNPLYMAYVLHMPPGTFYPDILRNVLSCGVLTALFCVLSRFYMPAGWLTLILCGGFCALLGAPLHLLIVCSREQLGALKALVRPAREHEEESK
jgi:O-antigen/teichoic acid export membrane protein